MRRQEWGGTRVWSRLTAPGVRGAASGVAPEKERKPWGGQLREKVQVGLLTPPDVVILPTLQKASSRL